MKVEEFAKRMGMKLLTGEDTLDKEVEGMYICDLLKAGLCLKQKKRERMDYSSYTCKCSSGCAAG